MKHNRSIPPATVIPVLVYPDVRAAVDWLTTASGFAERVRIGESHRAQMSISADGAMVVADVHGDQQSPAANVVTHVIKVRVDDVDGQFERVCSWRQSAGLADRPGVGERECTLEDLAGHRWQFSQTLRDVSPEEYGCQTVKPWY